MRRKFLEDLGLDKDIINRIIDENGRDIEAEKEKYKDIQSQLDNANNTIKERDEQLETLKSAGDVDDLKKQIETLQTENKTNADNYQKELKTLKVNNALEKALTGAKAKNIKAVQALLELGDAELDDDGTIKGLAEKIKELKKSDGYLFEESNTSTTIKGASPTTNPNPTPTTRDPNKPKSYLDFKAELEGTE
jgi:predicted  nucleic acid-binding Zn-ribbon protein